MNVLNVFKLNPLLANVPILYPYNLCFSGDFTGRKMGALAKNRLNIKAPEKATHQTPY